MKRTIVIDLYGGPGSGKSTTRAGVFHKIKLNHQNIDIEEVTEFAKVLTWEQRKTALNCQPFVFGNQCFAIEMLNGKVDVVITDSPLLMSSIYAPKEYKEQYTEFVKQYCKKYTTISYFLNRAKKYNPNGRNQTLEQAQELDREILDLPIKDLRILRGDESAVDIIITDILFELQYIKRRTGSGYPVYNNL